MKVALIGASGFIGSALRREALARGHDVTALVTRPERIEAAPHLVVAKVDVFDEPALARQLAGHDAVFSAFSGHAQDDVRGYYVKGMQAILRAVRDARVTRLLVVGGAGSLFVAEGVQLLDTPQFPAAYRPTAEGARDALQLLRASDGLDWTMLSPAAVIAPGERTTRYRIGDDTLLVDAQGNSRISVEDYAHAMLDELERPAHVKQRFTVGY